MKTTVRISLFLIICIFLVSSSTFSQNRVLIKDDDKGHPGSSSTPFEVVPIEENTEGCYSTDLFSPYPFFPRVTDVINYSSNTLYRVVYLRFEFTIEYLSYADVAIVNSNFPPYNGPGSFRIDIDMTNPPAWVTVGPNFIEFDLEYYLDLPSNFNTINGHPLTVDLEVFRQETRHGYFSTLNASYPIFICTSQSFRTGGSTNAAEADHMQVFPNPMKDYVQIELRDDLGETPIISLFDIAGRKYELNQKIKNVSNNEWVISLDTQSLTPGFYMLQAQIGENQYIEKLVKE